MHRPCYRETCMHIRTRSPSTSGITRRADTGMFRSPKTQPAFQSSNQAAAAAASNRRAPRLPRRGLPGTHAAGRGAPAPTMRRRATRKPEHRAPPARHRPAVSARHTRTRPGIGACRFRRAPTSFPGFGSTKKPHFYTVFILELTVHPPDYTQVAMRCHATPATYPVGTRRGLALTPLATGNHGRISSSYVLNLKKKKV